MDNKQPHHGDTGGVPVRKAFSQELHDQFDEEAKLIVMLYLGRRFGEVQYDPEGQYGIDLAVPYPDGTMSWHEVEVRPDCWFEETSLGMKWRYPTVHILERKIKWIDRPQFYLWAVDPSLRYAMVVPGAAIREMIDLNGLQVVPNKMVADGEKFADVPVALCHLRYLQGG